MDWTLLITGLTLLVGAVTLYIVIRQLSVMGEQQTTMRRQLDIIEKQDEMLAQRADLRLTINIIDKSEQDPTTLLKFFAVNAGNKTARDFYWHLCIPVELTGQYTRLSYKKMPLASDEVTKMEGTECHHFRSIYSQPLYPTRQVEMGTIGIEDPSMLKRFGVYWRFVSEDGVFPSETEFGKCTFE